MGIVKRRATSGLHKLEVGNIGFQLVMFECVWRQIGCMYMDCFSLSADIGGYIFPCIQ